MKRIKRGMQGILRRFGYRLARLDADPPREAANLRQLAVAYEGILNASSRDQIEPNQVRLTLLGRLTGTPPPKAYAIAQALVRTADVGGDVCEFGVAQGETSAFIANEISQTDRHLHLFDSFEGLPPPTDQDDLQDDIFELGSIEAYAGTMAFTEEVVLSRLAAVGCPADRYTIHKGFIESLLTTERNLPERVSFAFVDLDFYEPIKVALEFLSGVVPVGGVVIVDEYGYFSTGSKKAIDEFVDRDFGSEAGFDLEIPDVSFGHFAILTRTDR
jgi:hypothetical protein